MKRTFAVETGIFGQGRPKICVPVVTADRDGIWKRAETIARTSADMVEWRADFYEDVFALDEVLGTLRGLKERLAGKSLLFTFRTDREGGNRAVGEEYYYSLATAAAGSGCAALVDMEAYFNEERTRQEIERVHAAGGRVLASYHNFQETPSLEEMVGRLRRMEEMNADAAKLAVMPGSRQDVLDLLQATVLADRTMGIPAVTMSMGRMGVISRLSGALTGSAMTFATVGEASAPGQISLEELEKILKAVEF